MRAISRVPSQTPPGRPCRSRATSEAGVAQLPPLRTNCSDMNLPPYSPTAPDAARKQSRPTLPQARRAAAIRVRKGFCGSRLSRSCSLRPAFVCSSALLGGRESDSAAIRSLAAGVSVRNVWRIPCSVRSPARGGVSASAGICRRAARAARGRGRPNSRDRSPAGSSAAVGTSAESASPGRRQTG